MNYIVENCLILIPVLYVIGAIVKGVEIIKDKYIPLVLLPIGICNLDETKAFQIRVDKTISTVSALTTWLTNNPLTIVYELATPVVETVAIKPTDNPLQSYNDSTTLTLNNTIKGNISADIPTNVNAIIVNQASEIAKLQNSLLETQSALIETQYNSLT